MPVSVSDIKFSILILSIPARIESMTATINNLQEQSEATGQGKAVEILVLLDNCSKSISEKRNDLLRIARGKYIAFLDDDDAVSKKYLSKILNAIDSNDGVDCITFNQWCSLDGEPMNVEFGIGNPHGQLWRDEGNGLGDIKRPPYHMCVWRAQIATSENFNAVYDTSGQSTEDIDWLLRLYPKVYTEHHIDDALHGYIYNSKTTTSRVLQGNQ
jgi:glycosyltransferase involved in cell wall biosynthesis